MSPGKCGGAGTGYGNQRGRLAKGPESVTASARPASGQCHLNPIKRRSAAVNADQTPQPQGELVRAFIIISGRSLPRVNFLAYQIRVIRANFWREMQHISLSRAGRARAFFARAIFSVGLPGVRSGRDRCGWSMATDINPSQRAETLRV